MSSDVILDGQEYIVTLLVSGPDESGLTSFLCDFVDLFPEVIRKKSSVKSLRPILRKGTERKFLRHFMNLMTFKKLKKFPQK